jgi:hypothetical protein
VRLRRPKYCFSGECRPQRIRLGPAARALLRLRTGAPNCTPNALGSGRHVDRANTERRQRIEDRIDDRLRRGDAASLARALTPSGFTVVGSSAVLRPSASRRLSHVAKGTEGSWTLRWRKLKPSVPLAGKCARGLSRRTSSLRRLPRPDPAAVHQSAEQQETDRPSAPQSAILSHGLQRAYDGYGRSCL